jgi:hypothetical protein
MNGTVDELKLVALDRDDIAVVSAHVQDALVRVGDIVWQPHEHRFVMALNRFDWVAAAAGAKPERGQKPDYRRCRTVLRFDRVLSCKCRGIDQSDKEARLNLLAIEFAERDVPGGVVTMTFSGSGVIRLEVECLEAELADLGEIFAADGCPNHFAADTATA